MTTRNLRNATTLSAMIALASFVSVHASPAHGPHAVTVFNSCTGTITISAPGDYKLDGGATHAINCTSPTAGMPGIRITASEVNLDLGTTRFTKSGGGSVGILVSSVTPGARLTDVHIAGPGAIVGFNVGIEIDNVDDSEVNQVTVANSITHGIQTSSVTELELTDNTLTRNGWFGLNLVGSVDGRVRKNVVSANGIAKGLATAGVPNYAPSFIGVGIGIFGGSNNKVDRNSVTGNFGIGIAADGNSTDNKFRENQAAGNQTFASPGGNPALAGRFTNLFIGTGSTGNEVENNVVLSVEDDNVCGGNTFHDNTIITSYSNNGTTSIVGSYLAPLSLVASQVDSPSLCIW